MSGGEVASRILQSADHTRSGAPRVLIYTPHARGNPLQALMYGALWERGIAPIPSPGHRSLRDAEVAIGAGGAAAVHLHWTSNIAAGAESSDQYRARTGEFLEIVDDLKSIGVKVLWTIHNPIEHEAPFPEAEIEFRAALAEVVDAIHLMSAHALDVLVPLYSIDSSKVFVVPHPSYIGVYPDYASSADSRMRLGLGGDDLVVGVVGALRSYKRIGELHDACQRASDSGRRVRLLCAGALANNNDMAATVSALRRDPWATLIVRPVSDREMSALVAACDIISCVYDSPLTSGVSMLAMSLRRPVLLPDRPISRDLAGEAGLYTDVNDPAQLTECLGALDRDDLRRRGLLARERAEDFRYDILADALADQIEAHL